MEFDLKSNEGEKFFIDERYEYSSSCVFYTVTNSPLHWYRGQNVKENI